MPAHSTISVIGRLLSRTVADAAIIIRTETRVLDLNAAFPLLNADEIERLDIEGEVALLIENDMLGAQEQFNVITRGAQAHYDAVGGGFEISVVYIGRIAGVGAPVITTTNIVGHKTMKHHVFSNGSIGG